MIMIQYIWLSYLIIIIHCIGQTAFPITSSNNIFLLVPISTMSEMPSIAEQRLYLDKATKTLKSMIRKLPSTLPCRTKDGPLAKHFTYTDHDIEEGPYYTFNQIQTMVTCTKKTPVVSEEDMYLCI